MRVGEVGRDGEQPAERRRLLGEDLPGQFVAALGVPRSSLAARSAGSAASGWSGWRANQNGSRLRRIPVSEAMLSASPTKPQAQVGSGWPGASSPVSGMCTCPNSPAIPAAPVTTRPFSTTPPPSPVPTIADTEDRTIASAPKWTWWA